MNSWWSQQEWYCKCQDRDPWMHVHHMVSPHSCARCAACKAYEPNIPEEAAIRILLGPEMTEETAENILLGTK